MSQSLFTIDSIHGNSHIGVPVFSRFGHMQNYQYACMSPPRRANDLSAVDSGILDAENEQFKIKLDQELRLVTSEANLGSEIASPKTAGKRDGIEGSPDLGKTRKGKLGKSQKVPQAKLQATVAHLNKTLLSQELASEAHLSSEAHEAIDATTVGDGLHVAGDRAR